METVMAYALKYSLSVSIDVDDTSVDDYDDYADYADYAEEEEEDEEDEGGYKYGADAGKETEAETILRNIV